MPNSITDTLINALDQGLKTLSGVTAGTGRDYPAQGIVEASLDARQSRHIGRLMRVNHTGEICAQGLYHGQAMTAKLDRIRDSMEQAAKEESDHLLWCQRRMNELNTKQSLLNPLWYIASFTLGAAAGVLGDTISLGFVAEIEDQVHNHLQSHIDQLPHKDQRTQSILKQMQTDEHQHKQTALAAGGITFPSGVRRCMSVSAKLMTTGSYAI